MINHPPQAESRDHGESESPPNDAPPSRITALQRRGNVNLATGERLADGGADETEKYLPLREPVYSSLGQPLCIYRVALKNPELVRKSSPPLRPQSGRRGRRVFKVFIVAAFGACGCEAISLGKASQRFEPGWQGAGRLMPCSRATAKMVKTSSSLSSRSFLLN